MQPGALLRVAAALLLSLVSCRPQETPPAPAQDPKLTDSKDGTPSDFARFVTQGDGGHFDTAITSYRNKDGVEVTLFAAVHIADGAHYRALDDRFKGVDVLLYELVGPEDYRPTKGESKDGFLSMLQQGLKNSLELEFQLDGIDYAATNFVHADMTPEEFQSSMDERGETLFMMLWSIGMQSQKAMMDQAAEAAEAGEDGKPPASKPVNLVEAFRSGEGRHQLRLLMASQLEGLELAVAGGKGSTLLEGRNEKCLEVLQKEVAAGRKKLGVYYGAAHMPHMEHRLLQLGFTKFDHQWLVAWDCNKRPDPKVDRALWAARRAAKKGLEDIAKAARAWLAAHPDERLTAEALRAAPGTGALWWTGAQDPWGHGYIVRGYRRLPRFDVHSFGQDGVEGTNDDLHTATPRELRRMERDEGEQPADKKPAETSAAEQARARAQIEATADLKVIYELADLYRVQHGRWPTPRDLTTPDASGKVILEELPVDPWGKAYVLRELENKPAEVRSAGPDGVLDTDDDVTSRPPKK